MTEQGWVVTMRSFTIPNAWLRLSFVCWTRRWDMSRTLRHGIHVKSCFKLNICIQLKPNLEKKILLWGLIFKPRILLYVNLYGWTKIIPAVSIFWNISFKVSFPRCNPDVPDCTGQDGGNRWETNLSLVSHSSFCTATSSFFRPPKDDWSLDESLLSRVILELTFTWLKFAVTFPWMLSPYVPLYLMKSVSIIPADSQRFSFT